jgi:site-specific recombinase XerD
VSDERDNQAGPQVVEHAKPERRGRGEGRIFRPTYRDKVTRKKKKVSTWYIRYHDAAGNEHTESTGKRDRRVAVRLLNERLHAIRHGEPTGPQIEKTTYEDLRAAIENDYAVNGRKSAKRLKDSLAHLDAAFKGARVVTITEDRISAYTAARLAEKAANATVNRELAALKRMLRLGHRARKVGRIPHVQLLAERNRRKGFFEAAQFHAVLEHLPADLKPLAEAAYITGWRIASELVPLQWAAVDFTNGLVRIEDSKNGEAREFYFTPKLRTVLEQQRQRTQAMEQHLGCIIPTVFWRVKGPGVHQDGMPVGAFRKTWASACVKAGLGAEVRDDAGRLLSRKAYRIPHDFRRTAVRNLELAGVPRSVAMAMVGHKTESVYRRYAIVDAKSMRAAAEKLGQLHQQQAQAPRKVVQMERRR